MTYQPDKKPRRYPRREYLYDSKMKALKPLAGREGDTVWDAGMPGLCVRISGKGRKAFYVVKRRLPTDKNPTWCKLGVYPTLSLAEARETAREAIKSLERGEHPRATAEAKRRDEEEAKREAETNTFRAVAELYLRLKEKGQKPLRANTLRAYDGYLHKHLYPTFGDRPVATITRKQIVAVLDGVREKSGIASTIGAKSLLTAILALALDRGALEMNPAAGIKTTSIVGDESPTVPADRALSGTELAAVWGALPQVGEPFSSLYTVLLLTGLRLNEVAGAAWDDFDFDAAVLRVPAARSKNHLPIVQPLPSRAVEVVKALPRFAGRYVFTTTAGERPISAFSHAKSRLDKALAAAGAKVRPFTVHGFRHSVRTGLADLGIIEEHAEAVLNHKPRGIAGRYNAAKYLTQKTEALRLWQEHLLSLVEPPPEPREDGGKVVPMRRTRHAAA
jgi:integrase